MAAARRRWRREAAWSGALAGAGAAALALGTIPTTLVDFLGPGTQPTELNEFMLGATHCAGCHGSFDASTEPLRPWAVSLMGQAARDPIFHAALAIAEQDAAFAGDLCLRCHAPAGWVQGRSVPTNGSPLLTPCRPRPMRTLRFPPQLHRRFPAGSATMSC